VRTRVIWVLAAVVGVGAAYVAGYWPERGQRIAAEGQVEALETKLTLAEAHVRTGALLGRVLTVRELIMRQDYGQALERSSALFDDIRREITAMPDGQLRDGLAGALTKRDRVTAGLAKADPGTAAILHDIELELRSALGYEMLPATGATP
jgi:hypothetical protein